MHSTAESTPPGAAPSPTQGPSDPDLPGLMPDVAPAPGWSERRETLTQIRRFLVIGLCSVGVDLSTYVAMVRLGHVQTDLAKGISYVLGMIVGFIGNKLWTFRSSRKNAAEPITYIALYAFTLAVNIGVNRALLSAGAALFPHAREPGVRAIAAFAALSATGVTTVLNFLGMRLVTFRAGIQDRRRAAGA